MNYTPVTLYKTWKICIHDNVGNTQAIQSNWDRVYKSLDKNLELVC